MCHPIWQKISTTIFMGILKSEAVFADAFYYVACLNRADQHHEKAVSIARRQRGKTITTTWVLIDVADALSASASRRRISAFIAALKKDLDTTVIPAAQNLFQRGLQLYDSRPDKNWALTDCISFAAVEENKLTDALTGDHHFEQAGFEALLK